MSLASPDPSERDGDAGRDARPGQRWIKRKTLRVNPHGQATGDTLFDTDADKGDHRRNHLGMRRLVLDVRFSVVSRVLVVVCRRVIVPSHDAIRREDVGSVASRCFT